MLGTACGLALACGINAYAPLLVLGLMARADRITLQPGFDWLQSPLALLILGLLTLADLVADKLPGVDHGWDLIHTAARPVAAILCFTAVFDTSSDVAKVLLAALAGTLGGAVHSSKATARLAATGGGGGFLSAPISLIEDVILVLMVILSFVAPRVMLALAVLLLGLFIWLAPLLWFALRLQLSVLRAVARSILGGRDDEPLEGLRHRSLFAAPRWALNAATALTGPDQALVSALHVTTSGIKSVRHAWLISTEKQILIVSRSFSRRVRVFELPLLYIRVARFEQGWLFPSLDLLDLDGTHLRIRFLDAHSALVQDVADLTTASVPPDARRSAAEVRPRARRIG